MKVIIAGGGTGGHLFPAVAVGEALKRLRPELEVMLVGAGAGLEASWLPSKCYKYILFDVHGVRGHGLAERARALREFLFALRRALVLLSEFPAALVVSAGGYASVPMAVAAVMRRVPLLLMEQNTRPGLANRLLWRFARKVCLGFSEAADYFSPAKVEVTGNPIRFAPLPRPHRDNEKPLQILVLGGSSGAHRLNIGIVNAFKIVENAVIKLAARHQTGVADEGLVRSAYVEMGMQAEVVPFIDDIASALAWADLVVARAGAMTVSEVALAGCPAIFVPYPFHRDRQQEFNARVIEKLGGALIVADDAALGANLAAALDGLVGDRARLAEMGARAAGAAKPDAAARVARICLELAQGESPAP